MSIWMDMTNSLSGWKGGVVGIIRAELEIARHLRQVMPEVCFVKYDGGRFVVVKSEELNWLWECGSVGDAYLKATGRTQTADTLQETTTDELATMRKQHTGLNNAYAYSTSRLLRGIWGLLLFANSLPRWIQPVAKGMITFLSWPLKKLSVWRAQRRARLEHIQQKPSASKEFSHPFEDGDLVFSCGWMFSGKEEGFEQVKSALPQFSLIYLIYDIILLKKETTHFYPSQGHFDFHAYIEWASFHCSALLYGGETAMMDTQAYQKKHRLPELPGYPVYFGSDIVRSEAVADATIFFQSVGITGPYLLTVGSMDHRKNYATLYRAFTILADEGWDKCPQLVIVGKGKTCRDLLDTIQKDMRTQERIILVSPTDEELDLLYRKAEFVLLPSVWEGWSLTLPEALGYRKLIIASDVAPLREVGGAFAIYADTFDPFDWAAKIRHYITHPDLVKQQEEKIKAHYTPISWGDCGQQIATELAQLQQSLVAVNKPTIYFDLSASWHTALYGGKITGILRAELMLLKHLYFKYDNIKLFAIHNKFGYQPIALSAVIPILTGKQLDMDFNQCKGMLGVIKGPQRTLTQGQSNDGRQQSRKDACWFLLSTLPLKWQKKLIARKKASKAHTEELQQKDDSIALSARKNNSLPMQKGDIVFNAGTGSGQDTYKTLLRAKAEIGYLYCTVIYDFTPVLLPQVHREETIEHYTPFLEFASKMADFILYGGETAQRDGIAFQQKRHLPQPPSASIKFGSDIAVPKRLPDKKKEQALLKKLGIDGPFIMAVGTMEVRKNHETLYRAYLRMLEQYEAVPQMVFAGHPGWKVEDFLQILGNDQRVKDKILCLSPSDEELDALYRHCEFTLLASLYEGWSLTLPESMWYGKFCLCCDTPALRETAGALSEYIHAWDEKKWSDRIYYYHTHPIELAQREAEISKNWIPTSWDKCATSVMNHLKELM